MQELSCTWVPGTFDIVRLTLAGRTLEMTSLQLTRLLGHQALHDLYLKGRARVQLNAQQVALIG